jgi:hypothetical protein
LRKQFQILKIIFFHSWFKCFISLSQV